MQRDLEQWFFKITDYADRLDDGLDTLEHWPEKVKPMQRNWIGRSVGADVEFAVPSLAKPIRIFTTRPDTIYGATFMVARAGASRRRDADRRPSRSRGDRAVDRAACAISRTSSGRRRGRKGASPASTATNPFTNEQIPIWLGNFVLMQYGTGAIMAVPGHDQRDFEFAQQYGLPIRVVVTGRRRRRARTRRRSDEAIRTAAARSTPASSTACRRPKAIARIIDEIERRGIGKKMVRYRLRDWLISRQRYWGTPIPMIYCERDGIVPVPEEQLPVRAAARRAVHAGARAIRWRSTSASSTRPARMRRRGAARDRHDGHVRRFVVVLRALHLRRTTTRRSSTRRSSIAGCRSISTSAASSTRSCICSTRASSAARARTTWGYVLQIEEPFTRLFNQGMITRLNPAIGKSRRCRSRAATWCRRTS